MNKFIALISVCILSILASLGNFWFTYGIWPKSWTSYVVFAIISLILSSTIQKVLASSEQIK